MYCIMVLGCCAAWPAVCGRGRHRRADCPPNTAQQACPRGAFYADRHLVLLFSFGSHCDRVYNLQVSLGLRIVYFSPCHLEDCLDTEHTPQRLKSEKLQTRLDAVLEERNELNRIVRDLKVALYNW